MRSRVDRHLASLLGDLEGAPRIAAAGPDEPNLPPEEFNWRGYVSLLLHVAAEIEHSLMTQYLFAAYSLGGPQVPPALREDVRGWQETILGIAKEEMGHLLTVQNLLTALGCPLNLDREDYPWGSAFYPFDFTLQRLTPASLAAYVCAESPENWSGPEAEDIKRRAARGAGRAVNRVGVLYETLVKILERRDLIGDTSFDASTLPRQASWDEWGRGYRHGARGREASNMPDVPAPDLLILQVASRDMAVNALNEIGEQGEALEAVSSADPVDADERSHFRRFLGIYEALGKLSEHDVDLVSRRVAENPRAGLPSEASADPPAHRIKHSVARNWAHLFNLRYRILLVNVAHAFGLGETATNGTGATARGALINRAFAEMYNLRAIAGQLVELPLDGDHPDGPRAGPPFEMPYTLDLPVRERDRWELHHDLLEGAQPLIAALLPHASPPGDRYLTALAESDQLTLTQVNRMLAGAAAIREPA